MRAADIFAQQGLEIDDIRWYLASLLAHRLLGYRGRPEELVRLIWSGKLEAEMYNAEERFLAELDQKLERASADEQSIREVAREIAREKRRRNG